MNTRQLWTIGHSTLAIEAFLESLKAHEIKTVVDVRTLPGSKRYPQFNAETLSESLRRVGIKYIHMPALGGLRKPRRDSPNTIWRNASFRGYADYMMTPEFSQAIDKLLAVAARQRTAIMCAEAVWWQCHRSMIADYLKAQGVKVLHILSSKKIEEHPYTSAALFVDGKLTYSPAEQPQLIL